MNPAEAGLLLAVIVIPLMLGAVAVRLAKPWWWAAAAAVVVAMVAAIAPTPEPGESRVTGADVPFLLVVALVVTGLVWLGAYATRRIAPGSRA